MAKSKGKKMKVIKSAKSRDELNPVFVKSPGAKRNVLGGRGSKLAVALGKK